MLPINIIYQWLGKVRYRRMKYEDGKIILSDEENKAFIKEFKKGVMLQLHKENLLTSTQLNQVLKSIDLCRYQKGEHRRYPENPCYIYITAYHNLLL